MSARLVAHTDRTYLKHHEEDEWFDEVRIEAPGRTLLRLVVNERWKESELSGDEWRFSCDWRRPAPDGGWVIIPGHGAHHMRDGMTRLYPLVLEHLDGEIYTPVSVHFYRKGHLAWNGEIRTLRDAAGCLPWDYLRDDKEMDAAGLDAATRHLCAQPGCAEVGTVKYLLKKTYDRGREEMSLMGHRYHRLFCDKHSRRGDCGLEDADDNYERL